LINPHASLLEPEWRTKHILSGHMKDVHREALSGAPSGEDQTKLLILTHYKDIALEWHQNVPPFYTVWRTQRRDAQPTSGEECARGGLFPKDVSLLHFVSMRMF
jgi:hypothetical protein